MNLAKIKQLFAEMDAGEVEFLAIKAAIITSKDQIRIRRSVLQFLIEKQHDSDEKVRALSRELALLIPSSELVEALEYLCKISEDNDPSARALAIELSFERIDSKHLAEKLSDLIQATVSDDEKFSDFVTGLIHQIEPHDLAEQLPVIIHCYQDPNKIVREFSHRLAHTISSRALAEQINYLIDLQASNDKDIVNLSWELGMRISPDILALKMEELEPTTFSPGVEPRNDFVKALLMRTQKNDEIQKLQEFLTEDDDE